ncbi:MAG: Asd/ArgC dimerization domain-containing protein, partial [Chloroflexi bacterium]|nr:Asd/ArgC dimerization domain-containing protein [Chloroflexota bacterium]
GASNSIPDKTGRSHRHVGEMEQEAHKVSDQIGPIIFCPHLIPVDRGLMSSIYVTLNGTLESEELHALYAEEYDGEALVDVLPVGEQATLKHAVKTNKCVISIKPALPRHAHITSVTDNLRKGAASQAVQNMNLMFGFDETMGLI